MNKLSEAKTVQVKAEAEKRTQEKLNEMRERQTKAEQRLLAEQQKRKEEEAFKKQQQQIKRSILNENVERYLTRIHLQTKEKGQVQEADDGPDPI